MWGFFLKNPAEKVWVYIVRCLSMAFGVNTPQQFEEDESTYDTEI